MKKLIVSFGVLTILSAASVAFAQDFSNLENLSPVQKQKLNQIYYNYKQENNSLEMRITSYKDKLNQLSKQTDKSAEQINLLKSSYERNLNTLTAQQNQLKKQTEDLYKSVMTADQYKQYQAQQLQTENAFSNFLRK